jgi:hypothetical protein
MTMGRGNDGALTSGAQAMERARGPKLWEQDARGARLD